MKKIISQKINNEKREAKETAIAVLNKLKRNFKVADDRFEADPAIELGLKERKKYIVDCKVEIKKAKKKWDEKKQKYEEYKRLYSEGIKLITKTIPKLEGSKKKHK